MQKLAQRLLCPLMLIMTIGGGSGLLRASEFCDEDEYDFQVAHRINAHGDEFMSLTLTSDGRRLVIGTEGGKLLIWGIPEGRILKQLDQGSPVHCVAALSDPDAIIAAGGPHSGGTERGVLRKWNLETEKFEEWIGAGTVTFTALAADTKSGLVAAGNVMGGVVVWDSRNGEPVAKRDFKEPLIGLALIGRTLYFTAISLEDAKKIDEDADYAPTNSVFTLSVDKPDQGPQRLTPQRPGRLWGELTPSPDGRLIAARYAESKGRRVALLEAASGKEIASLTERSAAWYESTRLVLFDDEVPAASLQVRANNEVSRTELLKSGTFHAAGTPSSITGQVVSSDGSKAWEVFQLGAALVECDLRKKDCNELYSQKALAYAMDVQEHSGLLATGGDDGFVRIWKLSDLTRLKEFHVAAGVPQGVALMADGRHVVFSASTKESPTLISLGDVVSGEVKVLLRAPDPFVRVASAAGGFIYNQGSSLVLADPDAGGRIREFKIESKLDQFSVSANGEWLAVANDQGMLYCFEVKTGKLLNVSKEKIESLSRLAVTNDGHHVYTTEFKAALKKWDTRRNSLTDLSGIRGQAHSLSISGDGRWLAIGGNHHDVALYETNKGERLMYFQTEASDFYITNVWLLGNRLLFTTDAGVLKDGLIQR